MIFASNISVVIGGERGGVGHCFSYSQPSQLLSQAMLISVHTTLTHITRQGVSTHTDFYAYNNRP